MLVPEAQEPDRNASSDQNGYAANHATDNSTHSAIEPQAPITRALTQPELMQLARNQATFDSSTLTEIIFGGYVIHFIQP